MFCHVCEWHGYAKCTATPISGSGERGGSVGHLLYVSRRVQEQQHFGNQLIDFSTPPVSHMWVRLSDFYTSVEQDNGLSLILPGEVKVLQIFFLLHSQHQKWGFGVHFNRMTSKIWPQCPPQLPPPLWLRITAISDHLKVGEVPMPFGPQSSAAPVLDSPPGPS